MPDATDYFDETAEFYDAYYEQRDIGDVEFYVDRALQADGPVLEVACGTGRVYLELLEAGVDVDGFDGAQEMLSVLRNRAESQDLDPTVWQGDMRSFEVDRAYDLVIVPFRAFLHLTTIEEQLAALERLHEAVGPSGEVIIAFFVPNFDVICDTYGEWQESSVQVDGVEYTIRDRTDIVDDVAQIAEGQQEIVAPDGEVIAVESYPLKLTPKREFELLLRLSPFETWSVYGGFDLDPLESATQEMVWILEP